MTVWLEEFCGSSSVIEVQCECSRWRDPQRQRRRNGVNFRLLSRGFRGGDQTLRIESDQRTLVDQGTIGLV